MADKITSRAKRLLVIAMVTPWLFLLVYYGAPMLNSQRQHLLAVEQHMTKIAPQWETFRTEHPGFQDVRLFAYTGGDGMFGANGQVSTDEQVAALRKFMEGTHPPRPVFLDSVRVVGPEFFEFQKKSEPSGSAKRSQPIRSEPNPKEQWYSLSPTEAVVGEVRLDSQQTTNITVQSSGKVVLGFKTDVPVAFAAENRDLSVTLKSMNTLGRVSSGMGAATRFHGSPEGIHLQVSSDFSFPVRVVIYRDSKQ
jgi:hypothetical protein